MNGEFHPGDCAVIIGSESRRGIAACERIRTEMGDTLLSVEQVSHPSAMKNAIETAIGRGAKVVALGGGDGTLRLAAPYLTEAGLPMGIIPTGTGNALARELGVPLDPVAAVRHLFEGAEPRKIDVGLFNEMPFVTVATIGITSHIAKLLETSRKGVFGRIVYLPIALRAAFTARPFWARVEAGEEAWEGMAIQIVAAACRNHAGPFPTTETAAGDNGLLSIYVVEAGPPKSMLQYGWSLLWAKHTQLPQVWAREVPFARITLKKTRQFVLDGDRTRAMTAKLEIQKQALTVLA